MKADAEFAVTARAIAPNQLIRLLTGTEGADTLEVMSIWNLIQQIQIENLKSRQLSSASDAERVASRSRAQNTELHDRIGRVLLVTEALWELMSERVGLTVADLATRVREIDARDGHADGRHSLIPDAPQVRCPSCDAVVPMGKTVCQFCGAEVAEAKADPFRL